MKDQKENEIVKEVFYSKTLEKVQESEFYKKEFENAYKQVEYHEQENFLEIVTNLLSLGYNAEEINSIFNFLNQDNILKLSTSPKKELAPYYTIANFEVDKIERYENYQNMHNCSLEEAVLKVNIGLDHDFYTQITEATKKNEYTVLVNKFHSLNDYEPNDLKSLSYDEKYKLREEAANCFEEMMSAAALDSVFLRPYSAYRSFAYQNSLYNTYVEKDGKEKADTYSARPGHSEHQTGLAVDVWSEGCNSLNENDAKWLKEHSFQYGFIVRYTKENKEITGYIEEPWHLRYLGKEIATDVVEKNLTFDEYYDLYIK